MKVEEVKPNVFLDIAIGKEKIGRIVLELYDDLAPKSSQNFFALCVGDKVDSNGKLLTYKNTYFHRVLKNFMIQGGDVVYGSGSSKYPNVDVGKGVQSVYGAAFEDENLEEKIDGPFKLCMANSGANSNGSQFFITTYPSPHLNGKHTVFGRVIHGKSVVRDVEKTSVDGNGLPAEMVLIEDCGIWEESMGVPNYNASYDQIGGDIYEEYPDDDEHIDKDSSESVYKASEIMKESATLLFKSQRKQEAFLKYRKTLRYVMEYIPDEDQEPDWYKKYWELKNKLYLNLSLTCLQLKQYEKCINYSTFLIETDNVAKADAAKAFFRRGTAYLDTRKLQEAFKDLEAASQLVPNDQLVLKQLKKAEELKEKAKQDERARYAKFF